MMKQGVGSCCATSASTNGRPAPTAPNILGIILRKSPATFTATVSKRPLRPLQSLPAAAPTTALEATRLHGSLKAASSAAASSTSTSRNSTPPAPSSDLGHPPSSDPNGNPSASSPHSHSNLTGGTVRVQVVVPHCPTVPGEHLVLVGDSESLGQWDPRRGLRLHWSPGHMHNATLTLPDDWQGIHAKLVLVHGDPDQVSWEPGHDRVMVLQPPRTEEAEAASVHEVKNNSNGNGRSNGAAANGHSHSNGHSSSNGHGAASGHKAGRGNGAHGHGVTGGHMLNGSTAPGKAGGQGGSAGGVSRGGSLSHDYVVMCHWGHTDATLVLAREVPGEVLVLEQELSDALTELRTARHAAATSQEKLQRMAQDLASSERVARQGAEQLLELQAKHIALAGELTEAQHQAKAAAAEAAAEAAKASSVNVAEVEARVSERYETRMAELKQQLEGVKSQYSGEVAALQSKLEASAARETEAQELVAALREVVQTDVARLRSELAQLVDEYIAARQQLQEQAQQLEANEKLRMQQIEGLSGEIKGLLTRYNNAQHTISEQQRLLEELQASRAPPTPHTLEAHMVAQQAQPPPPPGLDTHAGRDWRSDWARLRKLPSSNGNGNGAVTTAVAR